MTEDNDMTHIDSALKREASAPCEQVSAAPSSTVNPHRMRVVVWDVPSAIECGHRFSVKLGVKCSSECLPDGWAVEIRDHDGEKRATATLNEDLWPGSATLFYTEVVLKAPDIEGLYAWEAKVPATSLAIPHAECIAGFGVRVVRTPNCRLKVVAIDMESRTPVKGAKVVVHPYRAVTNDRGVAELRVPDGQYRLFVSEKNYFPFRSDGKVKTDLTIQAELALDRGLSDADVWS